MPFYPDEVIEEVRSQNDIVDVVGQYVHLTKKGSNYFGICPFHNEKTGSFSVSQSKQIYHCFGCGAGGNVIRFLMNYESLTFPEALQELADRVNYKLPTVEETPESRRLFDKKSRMYEMYKDAATFYYSQLRMDSGKNAMDYFNGRKLTPETMQKFGLGYTGKYSNGLYKFLKSKGYEDDLMAEAGLVRFSESRGAQDMFFNRAMFPIMDANKKVIAFGGRVMGDGEPKYLNSPESPIFNKSRTMYGMNLAKSSRKDFFIICEGYMDVIAMHQAGFDNAVAGLGTALTQENAFMLSKKQKAIYLCYDSDGAGVKATLRALDIFLQLDLSCRVIHMDPYKDPDEFIKNLGPEEFQKRIENAEGGFFFKIHHMAQGIDMKDPAAKTKYQRSVCEYIVTSYKESIERENYLKAFSEEYGFTYEGLREMLVSIAASEGTAQRKEIKETVQHREKDSKEMMSERLLLTWIAESPRIYPEVRKYISPSDFTDELYRKVAETLFLQLGADGPNPAAIIDLFPEEEEQRKVAGIFSTTVGEITDQEDRNKALKETLIRVKRNSMDSAKKNGEVSLAEIVENKKILAEMEKAVILF